MRILIRPVYAMWIRVTSELQRHLQFSLHNVMKHLQPWRQHCPPSAHKSCDENKMNGNILAEMKKSHSQPQPHIFIRFQSLWDKPNNSKLPFINWQFDPWSILTSVMRSVLPRKLRQNTLSLCLGVRQFVRECVHVSRCAFIPWKCLYLSL